MMTNQKQIDKAMDRKEERIAWQGAKNNATQIVVSYLQSNPKTSVEHTKKEIEFWANYFYNLEPEVKKVVQEKKATEKQIKFIEKLKFERGEKYDEEQVKNLTPFQAKLEIDRLLKLPPVETGDEPLNYEGEKSDYNPDTGELL